MKDPRRRHDELFDDVKLQVALLRNDLDRSAKRILKLTAQHMVTHRLCEPEHRKAVRLNKNKLNVDAAPSVR